METAVEANREAENLICDRIVQLPKSGSVGCETRRSSGRLPVVELEEFQA